MNMQSSRCVRAQRLDLRQKSSLFYKKTPQNYCRMMQNFISLHRQKDNKGIRSRRQKIAQGQPIGTKRLLKRQAKGKRRLLKG